MGIGTGLKTDPIFSHKRKTKSTEMKVHWFLLSEGIGMIVANYHKTKQKYNFANIDRT